VDDCQLAQFLARLGGEAAQNYLDKDYQVSYKEDQSNPVTAADLAAEEAICNELQSRRPKDQILSEERGLVGHFAERQWIVDPIDGTINFQRGLPGWCSVVGLRGKETAIYEPQLDNLYWASKDQGAYLDNQKLETSSCCSLSEALLWTYIDPNRYSKDHLEIFSRLFDKAQTIRALGSGAKGLALLAEGRLDAWVLVDVADWDWLPGKLLAEEAGAETLEYKSWRIAAAGKELLEEIFKLINQS
jgi:myo-inositol-1(or 4)-monophosphatase